MQATGTITDMFDKVMDGAFDTARVASLAFLLTVTNDVMTFFVLIVLFGTLNFIVGLIADLQAGAKYSHKKAFHAFFEYAIAAIVILFTAAGARLIEPEGNYTDLLRLLTTLFALVYSKNIIRNFKKIQPDNEFIAVLDILINTKYLDFIKHLKNAKRHNSRANRVNNSGGEEDQERSDTGSGGESETANQ